MIPAVLQAAYDPDKVKPGWVALVIVIVLGLVTVLLWRSMNTQLRKIQMPPKPGRPPLPQATGGPDRSMPRPPATSAEGTGGQGTGVDRVTPAEPTGSSADNE